MHFKELRPLLKVVYKERKAEILGFSMGLFADPWPMATLRYLEGEKECEDVEHNQINEIEIFDAVAYARRTLSLDRCIEVVCKISGEDKDAVLSHSRKVNLADQRHIFCYFAYKYSGLSLSDIGAYLSGRDHSTVINSLTRFAELYKTDKEFKNKADAVESFFIDFTVRKLINH